MRDFFVVKKLPALLLSLFLMTTAWVVPTRSSNRILRSASPNVSQTIRGIENAATLGSFYVALAAVRSGHRREPVHIVQYGDSHTAADLMTGVVRKNFQRDFVNVSAMGAPAVTLDALGIIGARAVRLTSWSDSTFSVNVARRRPDLIILAYGTNEVTDNNWSIESYQRMFAGILRRFRRAAPQASLLVLAPPDRAVRGQRGWQSVSRMAALIEAQRRAAIEAGAAFWSAYGAMGSAGSMNDWVRLGLGQPDHAHLTRAGYARLGNMFYQDIVDSYNNAELEAR
jgi:lysophospholipase L1-like esterase